MVPLQHIYYNLLLFISIVQNIQAFTIKYSAKVPRLSPHLATEHPLQEETNYKERAKLPDSKNVWIVSRTIPIIRSEENDKKLFLNGCIKVWELESPSELINMHWSISPSLGSNTRKDPFGVVMWPGSILASQHLALHQNDISNQTVVVLGAGTGVEAQAAAYLGAKKVFALDVNRLTLKLANYGAEHANLDHIIECQGEKVLLIHRRIILKVFSRIVRGVNFYIMKSF